MADYTILVIDYEPRAIEKARQILEAAGYRVAVASDGATGLQAFEDLRPVMTFVEVMLPKKPGLEVCQELKATPHGQKTPVVVMSSRYRTRQYRSQALQRYGADAFVEKPLTPDTMLKPVRGLLDQAQAATAPAPVAPAPVAAAPVAAADNGQSTAAAPAREPAQPVDAIEAEITDRLDSIMGGLGGGSGAKGGAS